MSAAQLLSPVLHKRNVMHVKMTWKFICCYNSQKNTNFSSQENAIFLTLSTDVPIVYIFWAPSAERINDHTYKLVFLAIHSLVELKHFSRLELKRS